MISELGSDTAVSIDMKVEGQPDHPQSEKITLHSDSLEVIPSSTDVVRIERKKGMTIRARILLLDPYIA